MVVTLAYCGASVGGELDTVWVGGGANESSCRPNPVGSDRRQSTPIGSWTARCASCRPNPVWSDRHQPTPIGSWTACPEHRQWSPKRERWRVSRVSTRKSAQLQWPFFGLV